MANILRFLLALATLPFAWGVMQVFVSVMRRMLGNQGLSLQSDPMAFLLGFVLMFVVLLVFPSPIRLYVFGHELTHAVWGLCFGAKVSNLRVGLRGGSVTLTKSNVWITLAPYFFPFYTVLVICLALMTRFFVSPLPCKFGWLFAIGATWCFHLFFTLRSLFQRQPDVEEYGHLFSYVFILIFTLAGAIVGIVCTTEISARSVGRAFVNETRAAYMIVGQGGMWVYERVRSLPVLQK